MSIEVFFESMEDSVRYPELILPKDPTFSLETLPIANSLTSSTYRGRYNNSVVSIKVLRGSCNPLQRKERSRFRRRLERELITWSRLKHPNISPVCGLMFAFGKLPAVVTPYYRNGDINRYISKNPGVQVIRLLEMVAAGLTYMHHLEPPVFHGDIRGCNILITDEGVPVLTDIGTSHLPYPPDWTIGSDDGTRWMAPEVMYPDTNAFIGGTDDPEFLRLPVTHMSDVYSFGMTMLEVYTGRVPFSHRRFYGGVIHDVVSGLRPPRPSISAHSALTDEVWEVMQSCWEQKPKHRPTIGNVKTWLRLIYFSNTQQRC